MGLGADINNALSSNKALNYQSGFSNDQPKYGYTESGLAFLNGNTDSEINAINQEALWKREDLLRKEGNEWDARELDRLIQAAERNGVNPIFLLDSMHGGSSASYSTSAAKANSYDDNAKTNTANAAKVVGAIIAAIAMIAAAA